jgi:glycosyltransferase involved in cell wall biosynthesis
MAGRDADEAVTVLIPARNAAHCLAFAVNDLRQGLAVNDEILIVDDGSEDETPVKIGELQSQDARIRSIRTTGIGLVRALNLGLVEATNDWIARADADDRYPHDRLPAQRAARHSSLAAVVGDYHIASNSKNMGYIPCALTPPFVELSLIHPQRVPHPGIMYNRIAVLEAGSYQEAEFPVEDLGLWFRLANIGDFIGVPRPVVTWKLSQMSTSHTRQKVQRALTDQLVRDYKFPKWTHLTEQQVVNEIQSYKGFPEWNQRLLLLIRDLVSLSHRYGRSELLKPALKEASTQPLRTASAAGNLIGQRIKRNRWRGQTEP